MSRSSASPTPPPPAGVGGRVAVVGAESPDGAQVRAALARLGVPGSRVDLYGLTRGEAVLSEYRGEARLIQEPEASEVGSHGTVLLCEPGGATPGIVAERSADTLIIDLAACIPEPNGTAFVHMGINPAAQDDLPGLVAVPHGIAAVFAEVLHPIDTRLGGVRRASAVVLRPAADFGEPGLDELREQTVRLFNFGEIPRATFGGQLSFNVVPDRGRQRGAPLDDRIAREVSRILGWPAPRLAVRLLDVPVFHGHAAFLNVELAGRPGADAVARALDGVTGLERTTDGRPVTPMQVAAERRTVIGEVSDDGTGGYWMWLVAGEVGAIPAELAVRVARLKGNL